MAEGAPDINIEASAPTPDNPHNEVRITPAELAEALEHPLPMLNTNDRRYSAMPQRSNIGPYGPLTGEQSTDFDDVDHEREE